MKAEIRKLYDEIKKHDTIVVLRHVSPDLDAISSQLAVKYLIENTFSDKDVYAFGSKGTKEFLYIGEVDTYYNQDIENALYIVVDTANAQRIEWDQLPLSKNLIKIDHHIIKEEDLYGKVNILNPEASSTCEVVYNIIKEFQEIDNTIDLDEDIARMIFCGTFGDTGGFVFPSTTGKTYAMLSELMKYDFGYEDTVLSMRVHDHKVMKIVGHAYSNIVINNNGVGYIVFDKAFQKANNVKPSDLSIIVNFLGSIKELETWAVFNYHDNFIRVNLRSRHYYDVSKVANFFGGGGHKNASGAMIHNNSEIELVLKQLNNMVLDAK